MDIGSKFLMTREGFNHLEELLKQYKKERPEVIDAIATAREYGDLKENAEYHAARERQSFVEGMIQEIESKIAQSYVIDPKTLKGNKVQFGATVTIVNLDTEVESTYQIVGIDESDVENGKISYQAPLAKSLMNKEVGETALLMRPGKTDEFEILNIRFM